MLDRLSSSIRNELDKNPERDLIFQFKYSEQALVVLQNHDLLFYSEFTPLLTFFYDRCPDVTLQQSLIFSVEKLLA